MMQSKKLRIILGVSIGVMIAVLSAYIISFVVFFNQPISDAPGDWGTFGDYFGGLLNPVISLLNVFVTIEIAKAVQSFSKDQAARHEQLQREQMTFQADTQREMINHQLKLDLVREFSKEMNDIMHQLEMAVARRDSKAVDHEGNRFKGLLEHYKASTQMFFTGNLVTSEVDDIIRLIERWLTGEKWKDPEYMRALKIWRSIILSKLQLDVMIKETKTT